MYTVPPPVLPGNLLTLADSDFEIVGSTWSADTNANAPIRTSGGGAFSSSSAFSGSEVLMWSATSAADTIISSGYYPCAPNNGYAVSGALNTLQGTHDSYIGVRWYTSGHALISTSWGNDFPASTNVWQSQAAAVTSPATAAYFKVAVWVSTSVNAGEYCAIDLMYVANSDVQVLIDWCNPAFIASSIAGNDFFDMTPWVRLVDKVNMTRGRQNGVSEIAAGQAQFTAENDTGWFTPGNSGSPIVALGGSPALGARCQINVTDQAGTWWTRFDGPVSEIDYTIDPTTNTNVASIVCADVLAFLSRQDPLQCWTKQSVIQSAPWLHWTLNDANNSGSLGSASETSGNNGPALHAVSTTASTSASIGWANSNGGVETLADAARAGQPDGSEYWTPGSPVSSGASGLDSGAVGPYTTPLSSAYFTPVITTSGSAQDTFICSSGYTLTGGLSGQSGFIAPTTTGTNYAVELWFAPDPNVWSYSSSNTGPFICLSLGAGRQGACLVAGLFPTAGVTEFLVGTYSQPPAYSVTNWGGVPPTRAGTAPTVNMTEKSARPHHLVLNITGQSIGTVPTCEVYLDNVDLGSLNLPAGIVFDTVCVGGAFGGFGNWYGNIQLVSIYQRLLPTSEIQQHCQAGQFGMWEQPTDNCIATLGQYAGLPSFWNGLIGSYNGLSLTDYFDITGNNALSSMQIYEQVEQGLLYVPASGALSFVTRDWRMGYGAPDLNLTPDVYNSDIGYQAIDQYIINEAAISTATYQKGVAWLNNASYGQYGTYSNGTSQSPTQLPLITWSRAYGALGLAPYYFWPDPCLNDNAAWQVNTKDNQRLTMGTLTCDLLTLDPTSGLTTSQLYGVDIGNMVSLQSYDQMVLNYSPVIYYPLDDAAGADLAGNAGTLTPSIAGVAVFGATPSPVVSSPSCAYFPGVSGILSSPYEPSGGSNWTAECWFNLNGATPSGVEFLFASANTSGGDNAGFALFLNGTSARVSFGNGSTHTQISPSATVSSTGWHYMVGTWNGSVVTLYVDGVSLGTGSLTGTLAAGPLQTSIGGFPAGGSYYTGFIGQCALTPTCFTAAQIAARYRAASNGQPASMANQVGANEFFIEGVTETYGVSERTIGFYTSPASTQRAWVPGHPVYGQLGVTSRVGISQPDLSVTPAIGKDVGHDAGGPYWPPQFTGAAPAYQVGFAFFLGTSVSLPLNFGVERTYQGDCLVVTIMSPASPGTVTVGPDTQGNVYTRATQVTLSSGAVLTIYTSVGAAPMNSSDTVPITCSVSQDYTCNLQDVQNVLSIDTINTASGTGTAPSVSTGTMSTSTDSEVVFFFNHNSLSSGTPSGWYRVMYCNAPGGDGSACTIFAASAISSSSSTVTGSWATSVVWAAVAMTFTVQPVILNNPANNGHQFIGGLEMRGLHDTLAMALQPPLTIVGAKNHAQTIPTGNNANPVLVWDNVYVDTVGGMAAVPGYANWYTCLVPGFYEISGAMKFQLWSTGAVGTRAGYITVAQQAAQAIAAGTATPLTVNAYVCPSGEQHASNNSSVGVAVSPSTRIYLGVGDMVAFSVTSNQGANDVTASARNGAQMCIRWCGYGINNDQVCINSSIGGAGTSTQLPTSGPSAGSGASTPKKTYTTSWAAQGTYSYYGTSSSLTPQLRVTNGDVWQGTAVGTGSQFGFVVFPYNAIHTALTGATINSMVLRVSNIAAYFSSVTLMLGYTTRTVWTSSCTPGAADHFPYQQFGFHRGQAKGITLGSWAHVFASTATALFVGNNSTRNQTYQGVFGAPSTWVLNVTYTK